MSNISLLTTPCIYFCLGLAQTRGAHYTCTWVEGLYATNPRNYRRFQRHTPLTTGVTQCCKRNFEQFARKNVIRFREIVAKSECERLRNFSKFYVVR